jgi:hexosaminidase
MRSHHSSIFWMLFLVCSISLGKPIMKNSELNLMPLPSLVQPGEGFFRLTSHFDIAVKGQAAPRLNNAASRALRRLSGRTGLFFNQDYITRKSAADTADLVITCKRAGQVVLNEDESYQLTVMPGRIELECVTDLGGLHGLETLLQLLQSDAEGYFFPQVLIKDQPRFPWRGLLIDVCRHWMPVDVIQRNLDAMAAVKLNVLHWHLSEDQGFRVESKLFPQLHEKGSDGLYYTQEQIQALIAYANDRGIRVVPEFDMPGHATAWFVGYPELAGGPGPFSIERKYGVMDPVMDPTKETTYDFLEAFWREMTALFPDEYVHIGGDENNGKMWNANIEIQTFMKAKSIPDNHALQAFFNNRLLKILTRYHKKLVGWDEIFHPDMPNNIVIQSWRGTKALVESARKGYMSILSNGYYIDLCQSTEYHYLNDPIPMGSSLNDTERKCILGGEATMWSEIVTPETIDARIWPRTIAIAERLWSPAEIRDVDSMYQRMQSTSLQLEELGLDHIKNYAMMLRRLTRSEDIAPLKTLVDLLEPVQEYHRHDTVVYTSSSPFTRVVDVALPESMPARNFGKLVDTFLADPKSEIKKELIHKLTIWQDNDLLLMALMQQSPVLKEIEPLSKNLQQLGRAGLEALTFLAKKQKPKSEWLAGKRQLILSAKTPCAEVELRVVDAIEKLIHATEKN